MAGRDLDAVQSRLRQAPRGRAVGVDDLVHHVQGHGPRHGVEAVVGHRGGGIGDLAQTLREQARDAARVGQLSEDLAAVAVRGPPDRPVAGNAVVAAGVYLGEVAQRGVVKPRGLGDDEAGAARGTRLVIGGQVPARVPAARQIRLMAGREDPVLDLAAADPKWREQMLELGHGDKPPPVSPAKPR